MAVSIERAGWESRARSPGEECLQVASISRSAVHQKAQADFSPAWAGTQWAVSNSAFWCENRLFGQFIPTFPSTLVLETLRYLSRGHVSNLQTFGLFFLWQKHVLFSLSGHFCAKKKKGKWMCRNNVPEKCGPHKLPDGCGDAISLTTEQQKSSHALDKGA